MSLTCFAFYFWPVNTTYYTVPLSVTSVAVDSFGHQERRFVLRQNDFLKFQLCMVILRSSRWPSLVVAIRVLAAVTKLDNLAAITLGGPSFRSRREEPERFALFSHLHPQFAARVSFTVERLCDSRRAAHHA